MNNLKRHPPVAEKGWQNSLTYEVQLFMVIESVDTLRDLELCSENAGKNNP